MANEVAAVYPGSFDPVTNGHLDVLRRASKLFAKVIIVASVEGRKKLDFSLEDRLDFLRRAVISFDNVEIDSFDGLLVDYARKNGASVIIRGLREVSDFEYEYQMAVMNRRLAPEIETVFLSTGSEYYYVSSSLIKEVAALGGDISGLVPECVVSALHKSKGEVPRQ
ncbi:pantetheine-phosphate adenylyltransferase [bacterium]|nr:pantetheine-phosphate adenylyltransferase [bacterium]